MWYKEYRDYPPDVPLIKEQVTTGKGIVGCEMHEPNGWGHTYHHTPKKRPGRFLSLLTFFFRLFRGKRR